MRRLAALSLLIALVGTGLGAARIRAGTDARAARELPLLESFRLAESEFDWVDDFAHRVGFVTLSQESYAEQHARALKEDRALIVWVGIRARPFYVPDALHHESAGPFEGVEEGIIVSRPEGGQLIWLATLPPNAPPEAVWEALNQGLST